MYEEMYTKPVLNLFSYTPDDVALAGGMRGDSDSVVEMIVRGFLRRQKVEVFRTEYIDADERYSNYAFAYVSGLI